MAEIDRQQSYYSNLASLSTGLLIGVLALMTFLLTAGLQHPHTYLAVFLYLSLALPALTVITHVAAFMLAGQSAERILRIVQQVLFILSVLAAVGLAVSAASIFFAVPTAPAVPQGAPPGGA